MGNFDGYHYLLLLQKNVNTKKIYDKTVNEYLVRQNEIYNVKYVGFKFNENVQTGFILLSLSKEY